MRWSLLLCLAALSPAAAAPSPNRSVDYRDVPLRQATERIFQDSGFTLTVEPNVPNVPVTLRLKDVPMETAARLVVRMAGVAVPNLELVKEGEAFRLCIGTAAVSDPAFEPDNDPRLKQKLTLNVDSTLRPALDAVFTKIGAQGVVFPHVPDVPIKVTLGETSAKEALEAVLQQAYVALPTLYLGQEDGVFVVSLRTPPRVAAAPKPAPGVDRKGSLNIRDVGLRAVIRILFRAANVPDGKLTQEVSPDLADPKLTLNLTDVTLGEALDRIVKAAQDQGVALHVERKGETYRILPGNSPGA